MELVLFYYTLLMLLVSILVAAVCLSAYLVSRKKTMLFLSVAFAFYFFDISLVFQDEFIVRSCGDALTSGYLVVRSLASVVTGGGFVTAFWVLLCDYLNETRRTVFVMPPAIFAIASVAMLVMIPDGDLQRFWFWSIRQFYMYWILLYAGYSFLRQQDEAERARMWRHRALYAVTWAIGLLVLAEDCATFLVMDLASVNLDALVFSAEHNYAENLLMWSSAWLRCVTRSACCRFVSSALLRRAVASSRSSRSSRTLTCSPRVISSPSANVRFSTLSCWARIIRTSHPRCLWRFPR